VARCHPVVAIGGLPSDIVLYPASGGYSVRFQHFDGPHVAWLVRTRVMCQAGRAIAAAGARGDIVVRLCERAPLWVVVHVRAQLRLVHATLLYVAQLA
jgi:hypothetical protein